MLHMILTDNSQSAIANRRTTMPKGYNDKAIRGILMCLEGCFEVVLEEVKNGKLPEQAMQEELDEIRVRLEADKVETSVKFPRSS